MCWLIYHYSISGSHGTRPTAQKFTHAEDTAAALLFFSSGEPQEKTA
jgi:hypothetical protein